MVKTHARTLSGTSVIISTRNRGDLIVNTIESLVNQLDSNSELIVVDQSDSNETRNAVNEYTWRDNVTLISSNTVGLGVSRNIGIERANFNTVLFIDDDCTAPDNWIADMSRVLNADSKVELLFCSVIAGDYDETRGFVPSYLCKEEKTMSTIAQKLGDRAIGAGMAIKRSALAKIGHFDEMMGPGARFRSGDDLDIAVRVLAKGGKMAVTNQTHVIHDGFRTWAQGSALGKRDWFSVGAVMAKLVKYDVKNLYVLLYEIWHVALYLPLSALLRLERPRGFRSIIYFMQGYLDGLSAPIDFKTLKYQQAAAPSRATIPAKLPVEKQPAIRLVPTPALTERPSRVRTSQIQS